MSTIVSSLASGTSAPAGTSVNRVYSHTIKLVQNDTAPELNMTLTDSTDGSAVDLTNVTVAVLKIKPIGSDTVKATIPMYRTAPYTSGHVFMQWPAPVTDSDGVVTSALDTGGVFTGEIELTYSDGKVHTVFDELKFEVRGEY